MRKLRSHRGETLAEVLVALLVVTLATLLLAAMATTSNSINLTARQKDEEFYKAISEVEAMTDANLVQSSSGVAQDFTVNITADGETAPTDTVQVHVYTSDDGGLALYKVTP